MSARNASSSAVQIDKKNEDAWGGYDEAASAFQSKHGYRMLAYDPSGEKVSQMAESLRSYLQSQERAGMTATSAQKKPDVLERFTSRARRALVLAEEEARALNHNYVGPEHILLGLVHESEGAAGKALASLGITLEDLRQEVIELCTGQPQPAGQIAMTPRARRVLELSLAEARQFGHHRVRTEHMLLGLMDDGNGPAAQVLAKLGTTLAAVRLAVSATVAEPGVRIDEMMEALADIRGRLTRIETHLAIGTPQDQR